MSWLHQNDTAASFWLTNNFHCWVKRKTKPFKPVLSHTARRLHTWSSGGQWSSQICVAGQSRCGFYAVPPWLCRCCVCAIAPWAPIGGVASAVHLAQPWYDSLQRRWCMERVVLVVTLTSLPADIQCSGRWEMHSGRHGFNTALSVFLKGR